MKLTHRFRRRYTLLVGLVFFVFFVLLATTFLAGFVMLALFDLGLVDPSAPNDHPFPVWLFMMLFSSVISGTVLTALFGKRPLRPFRAMTRATQEVAAGNFDVRLPVKGPDEIKEMASSFNSMAKELASVETLRSDFVSNISHEFKTPIVSIRGFAKLLRRDESLDEKTRNEYLDIIIEESERLSKLSSNVLLLSKLENLDSVTNDMMVPLDEQLRRIILLLQNQFEKKDLELDIDLAPISTMASEELLPQVWLNLLGNAIKFSPEGGRIGVALTREGKRAVVRISDQGVGLSQRDREKIFEKFYQGDSSRGTEGNGLGLALVRRIVEPSGGRVYVESELGQGSTFVVELPIKTT